MHAQQCSRADLIHNGLTFLRFPKPASQVFGQVDILQDGQIFMHNVILGHISHQLPDLHSSSRMSMRWSRAGIGTSSHHPIHSTQ